MPGVRLDNADSIAVARTDIGAGPVTTGEGVTALHGRQPFDLRALCQRRRYRLRPGPTVNARAKGRSGWNLLSV